MTESIKCPQYNQPLTKVGKFWICPTHGQLPEAKPFTPMRIFLSYGHDSNEELVRHIKADLEKRGHNVWFDKSEIKGGLDWRRAITEGIMDSNRVLSFLSKHSTRDHYEKRKTAETYFVGISVFAIKRSVEFIEAVKRA